MVLSLSLFLPVLLVREMGFFETVRESHFMTYIRSSGSILRCSAVWNSIPVYLFHGILTCEKSRRLFPSLALFGIGPCFLQFFWVPLLPLLAGETLIKSLAKSEEAESVKHATFCMCHSTASEE